MPEAKFAAGTTVPVYRSQHELHTLVKRFGATAFLTGEVSEPKALQFVAFQVGNRPYRLEITVPDKSEFAMTPRRQRRTQKQIEDHWEREVKRRWRVLVHVTKAILVGVDEGLWNFEEAMAMQRVLPSGRVLRDELINQLDHVVETGRLPLLLPQGLDS